jgi:CRP-like cAMP-binding protein
MELVTRMLDGSLPYDLKGIARKASPSGGRIGQDEKIERLQNVPLLEACTRKQLRAVARITEVVEAAAGTVLTRAGEPGQDFFLIVDGTASVDVPARRRVKLKPGDYFGEMSLLDGGPRSATVTADTPLRLLVINRRNFSTLLTDVPDLTQSILVTLSRRVRQAEQPQNA